jgi:putative serine protease PepD
MDDDTKQHGEPDGAAADAVTAPEASGADAPPPAAPAAPDAAPTGGRPPGATWAWTPPVNGPRPAWADTTAPAPGEAPRAAAPWAGPAAPPAPRPRRPRLPGGLGPALVGALVGALVAGGIAVAFDDDPTSTSTVVRARGGPSRPATALEDPGDIRTILDAVQPAVVRIDVGAGFGAGTGTGFIIDASGVIVTNAHVVRGSDEVSVLLADGDEVEGEVVGRAPQFDLAVVEVDRTGLPTACLGDSDELQVGDAVVAIGNALGLSQGSGPTVTTGIVSGLDRTVQVEGEPLVNAIQTDAAINPGNSGGPLVDTHGCVVGVNTAIAGGANNVGFAIAISDAKPVIEELRAGNTPLVAFLGVSTAPLTPELVEDEDLPVDEGAVVLSVDEGTAADEAGIEPDDVITAVNGTAISGPEDVARAVRRHQPGDEVEIVLLRDGDRRTLRVRLGEHPDF